MVCQHVSGRLAPVAAALVLAVDNASKWASDGCGSSLRLRLLCAGGGGLLTAPQGRFDLHSSAACVFGHGDGGSTAPLAPSASSTMAYEIASNRCALRNDFSRSSQLVVVRQMYMMSRAKATSVLLLGVDILGMTRYTWPRCPLAGNRRVAHIAPASHHPSPRVVAVAVS